MGVGGVLDDGEALARLDPSGMLAAVAGGVYPTLAAAQKQMGSGFDMTFSPNRARTAQYRRLYARYTELGRSLEPLLRSL